MSSKKLAILTALHNEGKVNSTLMPPTPGSPPAPVHGISVMLGGSMLSAVILLAFLICFCIHKTNRKKSHSNLPTYWRDPGLSLEIYTVESGQSWLVNEDYTAVEMHRPPTPAPPPAYDIVVPLTKDSDVPERPKEDETGLPSYETAVQIMNTGYV